MLTPKDAAAICLLILAGLIVGMLFFGRSRDPPGRQNPGNRRVRRQSPLDYRRAPMSLRKRQQEWETAAEQWSRVVMFESPFAGTIEMVRPVSRHYEGDEL